MEILHQRRPSIGEATISDVAIDGKFQCYALEDVIRAPGVKVAGETAIPPGRRRVTMEFMPHLGGNYPYVHDVAGYTGIFIHPGNKPTDTLGCLLTGRTVAKDGQSVGESVVAYKYLVKQIEAAIATGEEVWLDTRNPPELAPNEEDVIDLQAAVAGTLHLDLALIDEAIVNAMSADPVVEAAVEPANILEPSPAELAVPLKPAKPKKPKRAQAKPEAG